LTILENDKSQILGRKYVEQIAEGLKLKRPEKRQTWHTNRVFMLSPDLAYIVSLRTEHNMPEDQKESRITLTVRRTADGWKIIHCHFSFIPK
jgi:ketosteroid isomerase-like protein